MSNTSNTWNNPYPEKNGHWSSLKKPEPKVLTIQDLFPRIERWGIGWSPVLQTLKTISDIKPSYPPYDIIRKEDDYTIVVAVAGIKKHELALTLDGRSLIVAAATDTSEDPVGEVVHHGIAQRDFKLTFALAEHVNVKSAALEDGLLTIKLKLELPKHLEPKSIKID
jgi:molecular chaperone IbpA